MYISNNILSQIYMHVNSFYFYYLLQLQWSSIFVTLATNFLYSIPCLKKSMISIIGMGMYMVILYICKILDGIIQLLFLMVMVQVYFFIFQSIKTPFHQSVVIWIACLTHALCDFFLLTEFSKGLRCILASLITMQDNIFAYKFLIVQSFLQSPNGKIACYMTICYTGNYTSIVEIYNSVIISYITSTKKQVCKVSCPFLIDFGSCKVLIYKIIKLLMCLSTLVSWLFTPDYRDES